MRSRAFTMATWSLLLLWLINVPLCSSSKKTSSETIGQISEAASKRSDENDDENEHRNRYASSIGVELDASHRAHPAVFQSGDIIFGGLFPVHDKGEGKPCGALNAETGFQRLLAMMYAIDKLNRDDTVLPGVKIGIHAHDTCQHDIYAMERVLEFIAMRSRSLRGALDFDEHAVPVPQSTYYLPIGSPSGSSYTTQRPVVASSSAATTIVRSLTSTLRKPIVAIIGPAQSSITTAVASVLRLFQIPQISYAATSTELSDRARFDYFFRVVPADNFQAEVMASVVHALKWRYVWAVGDEGPYGYKGVKSFAEAIDHYVCIAQEFFVPRNAKDKFYDDLVEKMASNERARGVVLFCNEYNVKRILLAAARCGRHKQFYWLASDSWGAKQRVVQGLEDVAEAAVTILPQKEIVADFDVYMRGIQFRCNDPRITAKNPWLQEYWEQVNNCSCKTTSNTNVRRCPDSGSSLVRQYRQEGLVQFVIDSVYALAYALRNIQRIYCGEMFVGMCANMKRVIYNGTVVRDFIQNVSFYGISKNHIYFNSEGGVEGKYEVYQFRSKSNGTYEYVKTGWWNSKDGLALHQPHMRGAIQTFCARGSYEEPMPVSYCSDSCPSDMGYEYTTDHQCCWHCERCHKNQFLNMTTRKCVECPEDELQSAMRVDECEKIRFVHIDWATIWPCIPVGLAGLGLFINVVILYTLIRYNKTAIVKASGRESSAILLSGLTATFVTITLQPLWPSVISCTVMRLGMPVALTTCYAAIFTKTHRIYRIFLPSLNNLIHRPPFISPKSQIIMSFLCTGVSFLLSVVCLTLEPPEVEYLTHNLPETIVRCKIKNTTFFLTFIYDIIVIIATTRLAWQIRGIPENFNEAKYIAVLMYSSCVVWIGLMPIYFLVTSNYTVQMTSFLLCITLSAIDIQICMFLPKLYVVYTGKEDLLNRSGKTKFSYATARPEPTKHPLPGPSGQRNPGQLMATQVMLVLGTRLKENRQRERAADIAAIAPPDPGVFGLAPFSGMMDTMHGGSSNEISEEVVSDESPSNHPFTTQQATSLAMAILKSSGGNANKNQLALLNRRVTTISATSGVSASAGLPTPPTCTMESFSPNKEDNSADTPEQTVAEPAEVAEVAKQPTAPPPAPAPHRAPPVATMRDNPARRSISLAMDPFETKTDAATSPQLPLASAASYESATASIGNNNLPSKPKSGSNNKKAKASFTQSHSSQSQDPDVSEPLRPGMKAAQSNSNSSNQSNRHGQQPQVNGKDHSSNNKKKTQKLKQHAKSTKDYGPEDDEATGEMARHNSANPLFHSDYDSRSTSARSLSNHRSKDDTTEEDESQRLLAISAVRQRRRSPTLPVRLPELLMNSSSSTSTTCAVSDANHYSSASSLFFGKKQRHHLPPQSFNSMKPAGLVVVGETSPQTSGAPATGNSGSGPINLPSAKARAVSGKRYTLAGNNNRANNTRGNIVDANGLVNGWPSNVIEQESRGTGSGGNSSPNQQAVNRRSLMKKHLPMTSSSIDDDQLPSQWSRPDA